VLASTFAAALELVREGRLEAHQQGSFTPLYLRKRMSAQGASGTANDTGNVADVSADPGNA
jgi:chromatin segregation and condensation protein Rec8/ScpA/Scc1 (kleisin family)